MDALALANSFRDRRGRVQDASIPALGLHGLRQTVRGLFEAAVTGARPAADGVAALNDLARPLPRWRGAVADRGSPPRTLRPRSRGPRSSCSRAAACAQCGNPRCILYFLAEGRREFCSDTCANRPRVARHAHAGRQPRA